MTPEQERDLDEAMVILSAKLDKCLEQRWDDLALKMIADGTDPNDVVDNPPDSDAPWRRVTMNEALQMQKDLDLKWKTEVLEQLRVSLAEHYFPKERPEDVAIGGQSS